MSRVDQPGLEVTVCVVAVCRSCGGHFPTDDEAVDYDGAMHFATTAEALRYLREARWEITVDGLRCYGCWGRAECVRHGHLFDAWGDGCRCDGEIHRGHAGLRPQFRVCERCGHCETRYVADEELDADILRLLAEGGESS